MSAENGALTEWRRYWTLPLAAALGYTTAVLHVYSIGPYMAPIAQEFGFSRAQMSVGITIVGLVAAAMSVPIGLLVDKVGPRRVGLLGAVLSTLAFASLGTTFVIRARNHLLVSRAALFVVKVRYRLGS